MSPLRAVGGVLAAALLLAAAGCGVGEPPRIGPSGVDGLTIPARLPLDPSAYVAHPEGNRWLPLADAPAGEPVEGVATVEWAHDGVVDLLAEDPAGNLWWCGRLGEWTAGRDGARAGLLLPARPRRGDGFRRALVPGRVDEVGTVVAVAHGRLYLDVTSDLHPSVDRREIWAEGTGPVSPAAG